MVQSYQPVASRLSPDSAEAVAAFCDTLVIGVVAGKETGELSESAAKIDLLGGGWLSRALASGNLKAKAGEIAWMPSPLADGPQSILAIGAGDTELLRRDQAFDLGATVLRRLIDSPRQRVVISLADAVRPENHDALVAGCLFGASGQALYMSEPPIHPPEEIAFVDVSQEAIDRGRVLGDSINLARRLVNEPPNNMYPEAFADAARGLADETGLSVQVWDEARLESEGCRAILAVGGASIHPPRLVIIRHRGGSPDDPMLAIVGKGVTFDSGGLSIKPSEGMVDMKCDMAGAATVLGVMRAAALLKLPLNIVGLCGLAENMISGSAYRLGDVIETRSGTTIEIHNTDAEGRVVLADTLDVAVQHKPEAIIDLATLTGACMVALGRDTVGMMTNNPALCDEIGKAAEAEGEWAWQLPMFKFFDEQVKSKVADLKNVGDGRWGGAITAAKFLEAFVGDVPWVHLDIAGPAFVDSAKPHRDAGATGVMVRTLIHWLETRAKRPNTPS